MYYINNNIQMKKIMIILLAVLLLGVLFFTAFKFYNATSQKTVSIESASINNLSVECHYDNVKGNKVDFFIKDGKSKTITYGSNLINYSINTGRTIYFWSSDKDTGIRYDFKQNNDSNEKPQFFSQEPEFNKDDKRCKITKLDDSNFLPPSDITFSFNRVQ